MARQDTVHALVARDEAQPLREALLDLDRAGVESVTIDAPEADTYRGAEPDQELHRLVKRGGLRLAVGAAVGAVLGAALVLLLPWFDQWLVGALIAGVFGGAWGGGVIGATRGVQVHKGNGPLGEHYYDLDDAERERQRLLTVHVTHDRAKVTSFLRDRGATLVDSAHPRINQRTEAEHRQVDESPARRR